MAVLDQFGRPMAPTKINELLERQAVASIGSVRQIQTGHPADGLTPLRLAALLRSAETGDMTAYLELAEQMEEKDLHYAAVLGVRKRAIRGMVMQVSAGDTSAAALEAAEMVREDLESSAVRTSLIDVMDALGKGFSVCEIGWRREGSHLRIDGLDWVDPRWFEFDRTNGSYIYLRDNEGPQPLRRDCYLVHIAKLKSGLAIRGGLARLAAWAYIFKNYSIKDWSIFMEAYGHPLRLGKYGTSATAEDRAALLRAVRQIGVDMAAIIPKEMEVDVVAGNLTGSDKMYEGSVRWWDEQISKGVLGQVGTTDSMSGGYALGKVHDEVRDDIRDADGEQVAASLTRDLAGAIVRLNFDPRHNVPVPLITFEPPEIIDQKMWLDLVERGPAAGLKISINQVNEVFGIRPPEEDEELLVQPRPAAAPGSGFSDVAAAARQLAALDKTDPETPPARDSIDAMIEEMTRNGDLQQIMQGELGTLLEAIAGAADLQEVRDILAAFEVERSPTLQEALSRATYAARLAGEVGAGIKR